MFVKKLLDVEDLIYLTESQLRSVLQRLFKQRDSKLIPIQGLVVDEKGSLQVAVGTFV